MTEQQFLNQLELALNQLSIDERNDILQDIKEYFTSGREDGKSDSEIAASLGSPKEIADELLANHVPEKVHSYSHSNNKVITITDNRFTKADMNIEFGSLHVYPSDTDVTTIELVNAPEKMVLTAEVIGDTLTINLKAPSLKFFSFLFGIKDVKVNVALPKKLYEMIILETDNGSISADKMLGKTIEVTSDNGRIKLNEIAATTINAETDNGRIEVRKVQVETLVATTDNGRIELSYVDAENIHAETDNGRIKMEYVNGKLYGKTDNGRISLLTTTLDRMVDFETDNGSILIEAENEPTDVAIRTKVDFGRISVFGEKNSLTTYGKGTNTIQLSTDNGKITVAMKESANVMN